MTTSCRSGCRGVARSFSPGLISLTPHASDECVAAVTHYGIGHYGLARAFAVNPARQGAPLAGFGGLTAQRGQASGYHAKEWRIAHLGQSAGVVPETSVMDFGPNGLSSGCKVLCSKSKYPRS